MIRLSLLLTILVIGTPLLAQSVLRTLPNEETYATITLIKYCAKVDRQSHSLQSRMFAQVYPSLGLSSGWKEFETREAWRQAGKPKPVALVWYNRAQVVRVAITNSDDGHSYTDYCYRADGSLAELRSVPAVENNCDKSLFHCDVTFSGGWLYPPRRILTQGHTPAAEQFWERGPLEFFLLTMLKPEKSTFSFAPMQWPAFPHVSDLPFNELLYVCTNR
jgi:hypothetical protein